MDWIKISLIASMAVVTWLLIIEWNRFEPEFVDFPITETVLSQEDRSDDVPYAVLQKSDDYLPSEKKGGEVNFFDSENLGGSVTIITDVFKVNIDLRGGDIVGVELLKHLSAMPEDDGRPIKILQRSTQTNYIATSGLIGPNGTDSREKGRPVFSSLKNKYELGKDEKITVDLTADQGSVEFTKRFIFTRSGYDIEVSYLINNKGPSDWRGSFFGQIKRDNSLPVQLDTVLGQRPFLGGALKEPDKNFAKYSLNDIDNDSVSATLKGGWMAFLQHYFVSAWIPPHDEMNRYSFKKSNTQSEVYLFNFVGEEIQLAEGERGEYTANFYVGPKDQIELGKLAEHLDHVVDYGIFWIICKPIYQLLVFIHGVLGNWGWAIVGLTVFIKLLLFPLSAKSLKSMARLRSLQPEMERIKELYGDDRQKMGQEQMALWKKEKVNPVSGCLPMLLQMPVFISLYWVLMESIEIRHAPWLLWIEDLSAMDPYFVLPLLMGLSMWVMQKLQPVPSDPMQAKVMQYMPIAFTFMFLWFPSGLVLYWTVNNLLSLGQQYVINKQISDIK